MIIIDYRIGKMISYLLNVIVSRLKEGCYITIFDQKRMLEYATNEITWIDGKIHPWNECKNCVA